MRMLYWLLLIINYTVVPLLRDHPVVHTKVVFEEGWSFIRGRKQCKPKHVSSGIVVLNVRWSLIRGVSQEGDYCIALRTGTWAEVIWIQWACDFTSILGQVGSIGWYSSHVPILSLSDFPFFGFTFQ